MIKDIAKTELWAFGTFLETPKSRPYRTTLDGLFSPCVISYLVHVRQVRDTCW